MYFRLPPVYNGRMMTSLTDQEWATHLINVKLYHFLGSKPWKRRAGSHMNRLWWSLKEDLDDFLRDNPINF